MQFHANSGVLLMMLDKVGEEKDEHRGFKLPALAPHRSLQSCICSNRDSRSSSARAEVAEHPAQSLFTSGWIMAQVELVSQGSLATLDPEALAQSEAEGQGRE